MSADASVFKPFKKPTTSGTLTGKTDGSRKSCEVNFSYPAKERSSCEVHLSNLAKFFKNPLQNYGGLTDETGALAGPPAGLTQEQWNLATVFMFHYWSDSTGNKMTFLHDSVVFHNHCEAQKPPDEEEEVASYSSDDADAKEECRLTLLHQITGDPRSPPKSQARASARWW